MTVINPNSISGITSITLPSGGDNVLTIHTNDGTERFRIDSSGNVKVGSASTISQDGDVFFTGVTTATTFTGAHSGSGANLTSLPAAQLSGTLPAISATNLTNIPAANVTGTLPALTAANLTNIPAANIVGVCTSGLTKTGGFGKFASYALIADQKAQGTISGSFVSGDWRTRDLNTELSDADGIVSISSNQFTLQAGTYLIKWSCPAYGRNYHQSRLRNVTDGSSVGGTGASTYADYDSNVQNESVGVQRLTISSAKAFEVQHRCSVSGAHNDGFGVKTNFSTDNEIYTIVEIYKEA